MRYKRAVNVAPQHNSVQQRSLGYTPAEEARTRLVCHLSTASAQLKTSSEVVSSLGLHSRRSNCTGRKEPLHRFGVYVDVMQWSARSLKGLQVHPVFGALWSKGGRGRKGEGKFRSVKVWQEGKDKSG